MTEAVMTYAEMAERLRIKLDSARRLTRRKRWRRTPGNDGIMRIHVPLEELSQATPTDSPTDTPTDSPADALPDHPSSGPTQEQHDTALRIARLEIEVEGLRQVIAAEQRRADAAENDRDAWRALAERPWWRRITG